jgi:hypothetical protein
MASYFTVALAGSAREEPLMNCSALPFFGSVKLTMPLRAKSRCDAFSCFCSSWLA